MKESDDAVSVEGFHHDGSPVYLQSLRVLLKNKDKTCSARLLIDTGSQRSYISKRLASIMNFQPLGQEELIHALFGGTQTKKQTHSRYLIDLENMNDTFSCQVEVLETERLCSVIPKTVNGPWMPELQEKQIFLSDTEHGPVDLLLGADVAAQLFTGRREVLSCGLILLETSLGWTLTGKLNNQNIGCLDISLMTADIQPSELWKLEVLGIEDPVDVVTRREKQSEAERYFLETVKIQEEGRCEVRLPWTQEHLPLTRNLDLAKS